MSQRLAERVSEWIGTRTSRRGFLVRTAVGGAALSTNPLDWALRPISAYAAACECRGQPCACGTACCDGYTEFCCTLNGQNTCPPGTVAGGWWKADGSGFCGSAPRYYIDCNVAPGQNPCSCGCALNDCNHRVTCCTQFRYGQCHQEIPVVGAIMCRVVTCTPPWVFDTTCTTVTATDDYTATHDAPCLHYQYLLTQPPIEADADWPLYQLFRLYFTILGRYPDQSGFGYFASHLNQWPLGYIGELMVASDEFARKGVTTDSQFVDLMYQQGLGRPADAQGKQYMLSLLQTHTRGDVGNYIAQSQEAQRRLIYFFAHGIVPRLYLAALARTGEPEGIYYWDFRVWEGYPEDGIAAAFCATPEFQQRYAGTTNRQFVQALYMNVLGRAGEQSGVYYWTGVLDRGTPRYDVVYLFANSAEFKQRTGIG